MTETKFVFQTTVWQLEEDSKWAIWIRLTNEKQKLNFWVAVILVLPMIGGTVFICTRPDAPAGAWVLGGVVLAIVLAFFIMVILMETRWRSWEKDFFQTALERPNREDGPATVTLTEHGCTAQYANETAELFRWKMVGELCTWSEGWDILDKHGFCGIALRRQDLTEGDAQSLEEFLCRQTKKTLKPRAIELDELKRIYKYKSK